MVKEKLLTSGYSIKMFVPETSLDIDKNKEQNNVVEVHKTKPSANYLGCRVYGLKEDCF